MLGLSRYTRHLKFMGWLWLLLGGFWSLFALSCLIGPDPIMPRDVVVTMITWWQELVQDAIEIAFFVATGVSGVALLCHWRRSNPAVRILGSLWLIFSTLMISSASGSLALRVLWFGPSLALALYSMVVLSLARNEPDPV